MPFLQDGHNVDVEKGTNYDDVFIAKLRKGKGLVAIF